MIDQKTLEQIERIKIKLFWAKEIDKDFEVFAADSHEYFVGETISPAVILQFENEYSVSLPECYKAFLINIGNGGKSHRKSAAGPGYGIFPFGTNLEEFVYSNPEKFLKQDCIIYPEMSDDFWKELNKKIDEDVSDKDFENELGKIFGGILPLGTEGCTYYYGLILNGEFKGRVVNIDIDRRKPFFAFESSFLDWYERWLDEITEGKGGIDANLFNYTLGGTVAHILNVYGAADDEGAKLQCVFAILKKKKVDSQTLDILEKEYVTSEGLIQKKLLQVLTKFDYNRAFPYLINFAEKDLLSVFQFIFWYAKDRSLDWLEFIKANIEKINDKEIFQFCTYLLVEMKFDYGSIIVPLVLNENEEIRKQAYYSLGLLENKSDYLDTFILGLKDDSYWVLHAALQALNGIKDEKLLVHYKLIAEKFPKAEDFILTNLNHNLKIFELSTGELKSLDLNQYKIPQSDKKKWFQFWK
ncbi:SMI1/KNR4 family protein [Flavobacterium zhairuonense]|uniref:SMI1/KNR4 family protein n=1 Tax=Flavobacterium zhairuonense TaxID=2493631 RepID=UPI001046FB52|nr:SMI1/KNR4 family protein [Flavobacterium zhairuonense]KAF2508593.1 SMI1/KNR4 family protein [Flavobacterium zhairuonense]